MNCTEFDKNRQFIQSVTQRHYNEIEELSDGCKCTQTRGGSRNYFSDAQVIN